MGTTVKAGVIGRPELYHMRQTSRTDIQNGHPDTTRQQLNNPLANVAPPSDVNIRQDNTRNGRPNAAHQRINKPHANVAPSNHANNRQDGERTQQQPSSNRRGNSALLPSKDHEDGSKEDDGKADKLGSWSRVKAPIVNALEKMKLVVEAYGIRSIVVHLVVLFLCYQFYKLNERVQRLEAARTKGPFGSFYT